MTAADSVSGPRGPRAADHALPVPESIGVSVARPDAWGKVTGEALYPGDLARREMLHLAVVFAGRPHARIVALDTSAALAHPGVSAVLTARDVPYNRYGLIDDDQPALCDEVVCFEGDRVALVAAVTPSAAREGARLVRVSYEDLPIVSDPVAALDPGSHRVHAGRPNLLSHVPIRKGHADAALAAADVVLDGEFSTSWQEHAFMQPEAGIAFVDDDGRVVVESAGQWMHEDRRQIARVLGLPEEQVVVRYATIGGAFGGREDLSLQHLLALATWRLRRPVSMVWTRRESILAHGKRHPVRVRCRWGAMRDGRITALRSEVLADGGAYASTSVEVVKVLALFATGCYDVPHIAVDARVVYTNNPPCGAFRGFGAPQAQFPVEVMVTRLAHALGLDPVEMRRRNLYREGSIEPTGSVLPPGVSALAVLDRCVEVARARPFAGPVPAPGAPHDSDASPREQRGVPAQVRPGRYRRGTGVACGIKNVGYSFGFPEQATATVEVYGVDKSTYTRATVRVGAAEVGQGIHTALRQIAGAALGLPLDAVTMVAEDSSVPDAGSASASRLTLMAGRAVHDAAGSARERWARGEVSAGATTDHRARPGGVSPGAGPDLDGTADTIICAAATVPYRPPATTPLDPATGAGTPNHTYGYAAQAVEVEVDTETGLVRVLRIVSAHDVGRAINRGLVEGQVEGCLAQGIGYALLEEFQVRDGRVRTDGFGTYAVPTMPDMPPEMVPVILELADPHGPYGARGMAEMALVPITPAIAAAIHDATGAWLTAQPFTPERVLAALDEIARRR